LTLSQQRFTFLPNESDTLWFTPVSVKLFKGGQLVNEVTLELDERSKSFDVGEFDAYKLNSDMTGFYRVHYPEQDYAMLKELVRSKAITPIDRLVLEHELFALLRAGRISLDLYLDFIEAYADETSHMSLMSIAVHLRDIHRLAEADLKSSLEAQAVAFLDRTFNKIGFAKKSDEDLGISIIRGPLLSIAVDFDSDAAKQFALAQFDKLKAGERIDANIRTNVKAAAAKLTNDWDWFKSDFDNPENEAEFISTISAMNKFTEKPLLNKYMDMIFSDIPSRNRGIAIAGLSSNKLVKTEMFEWYLANLDSFEALNNFMVQGAILSVVSTGDENQAEMEEFFADYVKKNPKFADAVEVSIEQLNITKAFKTHLN
jgi:aminopeptidase N